MSGEKPFDPGDTQIDSENAPIIDMKAIEARMTPEQLAKYQADMERGKKEAPLREARATIDYKKNQAAAAVRARELASFKEERAAKQLLCLDIASAIHENNNTALDLYVTTYLKDKLSFKQLVSIEEVQDIFNQLSNKPEELLTFGQPESPRVEMRTVYCEVPIQNEKTMMAITATVDYTYNAKEPLVTFMVSKAPMPKKESLQAVVPLNKSKNSEVKNPSFKDVFVEAGKNAWAFGKKLLGIK